MQQLLPDIKEFSDYFTFQQDSAPACEQDGPSNEAPDIRLHHTIDTLTTIECGLHTVQPSTG